MHSALEEELEKKGEELRARHDESVIADVIGEVEGLDDPEAEKTAGLLRKMVGFDDK